MPKPTRRRPRRRPSPPLPPIGHYVLAFQAPDGSLQPPPIPLDQRFTDAELREVVEAVQAKLLGKIDRARALDGEAQTGAATDPSIDVHLPAATGSGLSLSVSLDKSSEKVSIPIVISETPTTSVKSPVASFEPSDIEAALRRQPAQSCPSAKEPDEPKPVTIPTPAPMTTEGADLVSAANGIPPAPDKAPCAAPAPDPAPDPKWADATPSRSWVDNLIAVIFWGVAIFWGSVIAFCGLIFAAYAVWKVMPLIDSARVWLGLN